MAVISGKGGDAKWETVGLPHVREWSLSETSNAKAFASSDTSGGHSRVAGNKDSTARVRFYLDTAAELYDTIRVGDIGTLDLYQNGTLFWSIESIVETMEVSVPIEDGGPVTIDCTFGQTANAVIPA